jgi:hypothetical protein
VRQCTGAALVLLGTAVLGTAFRQSMPPHTLCQKVLGRACDVPRESFVGNRPSNYLGFDLVDFVSGTDSLAYPPREDHFLNGLAKSSLYGVMPLGRDFSGARYELLAVVMNLVLLAMAAVCLAVSPSLRPVRWPLYRVPILAGASLLVLLLGFRIMVPTPFHEDFRHIFPVLVPLCLWYAKAVERLRDWSDWLSRAGLGLGLLMIGASVAFFLRPWGS